jgi:hypothetical protein
MKYILLIALTVVCANLLCQSNFIIAGQTDSMIYTAYNLPYGSDLNNFYQDCLTNFGVPVTMSIDFTQRGNSDCIAQAFCENQDPAQTWQWETLVTDTNCLILGITDSNIVYMNQYCLHGINAICAKRFLKGDTLYANSTGPWLSGTLYTQGSFDCCWFGDSSRPFVDSSYYFAKLIVNGDTLLAYLCLQDILPSCVYWATPGNLYSYACQGNQSYHVVNSIKENKDVNDFKLFPIPFNNQLNIIAAAPLKYSLYDIAGNLILSGSGPVVETNNISPGSYFIEIGSGSSKTYKRVVKIN